MKSIDVKPQPILPPGRVMQIAVTGVKYRLFRSIVTVAVIVVAMAFLMNILTESLIRRSVAQSARAEIDELHRIDQWIARLSIAQSPDEIIEHLADPSSSERFARELAGLMSAAPESLAGRVASSAKAKIYLNFFSSLPFGRKRLLAGRSEGVDIFNRLMEPAEYAVFETGLARMKSVKLPAGTAEFRAFLGEWPDFRAFLGAAREAQTRAIAHVQDALQGRSLGEALQDAGGAFGDVIRGAGFALPEEEARALVADAVRAQNMARVEKTINNAGIRQAVAGTRDMLPGDVTINLIWDVVADESRAAWFLETMAANDADTGEMDAATLSRLSAYRAHAQLLKRAELQTAEVGASGGVGKRMTWLALLSMLVCAVGIANAMLMSVTERFREIATLKCLGALDGFIMMVFLIEAALLGLVGGVGGAIAGFVLGVGRAFFLFGSLMLPSLPLRELAAAGVVSIVAGVLLAAAAAVYPSLRAAKLAPMEAMRIE